jgi:hypothetical protein
LPHLTRLLLIAALLLGTLARPAPVAAVSAGCSTLGADGRPLGAGQLFVQAAYGIDESTLFRFYVDGPEMEIVYEGHEPQSFGTYLSGLTPGTYDWMLDRWIDNGDGTTSFYRKTLATCTVSGLVDVPSLKGKTQGAAAETLAAAGLSLGAVSSASSATVAKGEVISQRPSAGSDVALGSTVVITISTGPAPSTPAPTATPKLVATPTPSADPADTTPVVTPAPSESAVTVATPSPVPSTTPAGDPATDDAPRDGTPSLTLLAATLPFWLVAILLLLLRARR